MSEKEATANEQLSWKDTIRALRPFVLLAGIALVLAKWLFKVSWGNIIGLATLMAFILLLAFLKSRYLRVEQVIEGASKWNRALLFWWAITFAPMMIFYFLSPLIMNSLTIWFQVMVFVIWGLLLISGSLAVLFERYRGPFLQWLQRRIGMFAPGAYAFNLLVIAILFFSSVTYVLVDHGRLGLTAPSGTKISPGVVRDFYSWHFLQSVPLLKANETLHWKEPLTYDSWWVGLMLVIFQLLVIVPVIAAFAWFWKNLGKSKRKKISGAPWQYPFSS